MKIHENKHMVGALLDRLRHRCHTFRLDGLSLRAPTPRDPPNTNNVSQHDPSRRTAPQTEG